MSSKQIHKYDSANSVCRDAGHDWQMVGAYWRGCQREHCQACQHFVNGRWVDAAPFYRRQRAHLQEYGLWTEPKGGER